MIKVLLVDDQELFRAGIQIIVDAQPDMTVVGSARDGREAVELARSSQPDIVLMDVRMPEMDGVEATKVICAGHDAPKVVVLTTFNLDERAAEAIRGGASGFLLKDTGPNQTLRRHPNRPRRKCRARARGPQQLARWPLP